MRTLLFIPARGGSKGLPNKNMIDFLGVPLIRRTIDVAIETKNSIPEIDIFVSSDSDEILAYARKIEGISVIRRPKKIAMDHSKTIDSLLHLMKEFDGESRWDQVVTLQPTSPLRTSKHLIEAFRLFQKHNETSLISCYKCDGLENKIYHRNSNYVIPLNPLHNLGIPRQKDALTYVRNGAIYITLVNFLLKEKLIISDTPIIYEMPRSMSIDIDDKNDLEIAKHIFSLERESK